MNAKTKNILLIISVILLVGLAATCWIIYDKYSVSQNEVVIWNDSTYYYKNKYNEEYLAKNTYIIKVDELKKYNDSLYIEYKSLKEHPIVITKTKVVTIIDTVRTEIDSIWNDGNYTVWAWSAGDSCWYSIKGTGKISIENKNINIETVVDELVVNNGITLDLVDNGQQLVVLAKTDNPYTDISNIQSVVIDPATSPTLKNYFKPKRWGFGPYVGVGFYTGYGWMPNTGSGGFQFGIGGSIGFSIHYDLIQW